MTSFLYSSAINNSIVLNATEDNGNDVPKRRHSFTDEDSERNQLKKRRKQSKPVRITLDDPTGATENGTQNQDENQNQSDDASSYASDCSDAKQQSSPESETANQDDIRDDIGDDVADDVRYDPGSPDKPNNPEFEKTEDDKSGNVRTTPLDLSKLSSGDSDVSVDVLSFLEKTETSDPGVMEPAYHQYQGPYPKQNSTAEPTYGSLTPPMAPAFKQFRSPTIKSPISLGPLRIFNPEAFCNLCNKEFCNKYFLKTHKANKHGIYSDSLGSSPLESYSAAADYPQNSVDMPSANSAVKFWFSRKPFFMGSSSPFPKYGSNAQNPSSSAKAFCNICQRQFCNKYFVRRHKAKIHGITESGDSSYSEDYSFLDLKMHFDESHNSGHKSMRVDPESGEYMQQNSETHDFPEILNSPPSSAPLDTSESAATPNTPMATSQEKVQVGSKAFDCNANPSSNSNSTSSHRPVCEVCEKEFCSRHSLRRHKAKVHGIRSSVISTSLGQDVMLERLQNEDSSQCSFSDSESAYIKSEAQDDSQQDCRKDLVPYSRTNFENEDERDGSLMGIDDPDRSPLSRNIKIEPGETTIPSQYVTGATSSTGPLDLAFTSGENDGLKTSENSDRNENCSCEICGKHFQSQFLLSMHKTYFHNFPEANHFSKQDMARFSNSPIDPNRKSSRSFEERVKREHNEEDIQKLHSLIMKLNNLNVEDVTVCEVCNEDLGHISSLENHILRDHSELLDEVSRMIDEEGQPSPLFASGIDPKLICRVCQNQFSSPTQMDQHVCVPNSVPSIKIPQPTASGTSQKDAESMEPVQQKLIVASETHNPNMSTSFCDICKKELCNKYFMKTHMQRMHNISIETGANVGGVVCDICNKTLCSKYFLRVHKQNSHGIVDDVLLPPRLWMSDMRNQSPNSVDASLKPTEKTDFSYKYFSHFLEVCPLCFRRFRSTKWLRAHLLNEHGEEGKLKWLHFQNQLSVNSLPSTAKVPEHHGSPTNSRSLPDEDASVDQASLNLAATLNENILSDILNGKNSNVKQCNYCPFSTKVLALLFMHERTHLTMGGNSGVDPEGFQCPLCRDKLPSSSELEKHVANHYNISSIRGSEQEHRRDKVLNESLARRGSEENGDSAGERESIMDDSRSVLEHLRKNPALDLNIVRRGHQAGGSKDFAKVRSSKAGVEERSDLSKSPLGVGFNLGSSNFRVRPEADVTDAVSRMKEALNTAAVKTNLPTTFAIPQNQDSYIMQPFFLENVVADQSTECSSNHTFLSSLVYLPVKQKLSKAVTVSFRLTPT